MQEPVFNTVTRQTGDREPVLLYRIKTQDLKSTNARQNINTQQSFQKQFELQLTGLEE